MRVSVDWIIFEASLKWPLDELQFLSLHCWFAHSVACPLDIPNVIIIFIFISADVKCKRVWWENQVKYCTVTETVRHANEER